METEKVEICAYSMGKHLLRSIIKQKVDRVSKALIALRDYIGKQNVGYVFWLPPDSLAINCKKQIHSGKNWPVSKAKGKENRIKSKNYVFIPSNER